MGGTVGEVRGKSKIEAYAKYVDLVDEVGGTFQDRIPDPIYKKHTKRQMVQDQDTGEWILHYRLHT